MPFEFTRRIQELISQNRPLDQAVAVAVAEFDRRYEQERTLKERLQEEMLARGAELRDAARISRNIARRPIDTVGRVCLRSLSEGALPSSLVVKAEHGISAGLAPSPLDDDQAGNFTPEARAAAAAHHGTDPAGIAAGVCERGMPSFQAAPKSIEFRITKAEKREIEGYAAIWEEPMRSHEMLAPRCFSQETLDLYMENPVLLKRHDDLSVDPIGVVLSLASDAKGLRCRARVDDDETWKAIQEKRLRAFSWGGNILLAYAVPDTRQALTGELLAEPVYTQRIEQAELLEISIVAIPNAPHALFEIAKAHAPGGPDTFSLWAPVSQIDAKERLVFGYAIVFGEPDADGHVITRAALEAALPEFRRWANGREMHEPHAIGTYHTLEADDFGLWVGLKVSQGAENAWQKVLDRTYKGFSIGGAALDWTPGSLNGQDVLFLTAIRIDEISICDRPKAAGAQFVLVKRQSTTTTEAVPAARRAASHQRGFVAANSREALRGNHKMDPQTSPQEALEEKQLGFLAQLAQTFWGRRAEEEEAENGEPPLGAQVGRITPGFAFGAKTATQMTALIDEKNAAMRKDVEAFLTEKVAAMTAAIDEIKALLPPSKAETASEAEAEKSEAPERVTHGVDPALKACFEGHVAKGLAPVAAFNAAASETIGEGEDLTPVLVRLGLLAPQAPSSETQLLSQIEQIIARTVEHSVQPIAQRLDRVEHAATVGRRSGLHETPVKSEENTWEGCFPVVGKGR